MSENPAKDVGEVAPTALNHLIGQKSVVAQTAVAIEAVQRLEKFLAPRGKSLLQVAVAWVRLNPVFSRIDFNSPNVNCWP